MGVRKVEDLIAWQLAHAFKIEVHRLLKQNHAAAADMRYCAQLRDAAASVSMNIAEGFYRFGAAEFRRFISIALASLAEATLWLHDGIERSHFDEESCAHAVTLAKRCRVAGLRLHKSLAPWGNSKGSASSRRTPIASTNHKHSPPRKDRKPPEAGDDDE